MLLELDSLSNDAVVACKRGLRLRFSSASMFSCFSNDRAYFFTICIAFSLIGSWFLFSFRRGFCFILSDVVYHILFHKIRQFMFDENNLSKSNQLSITWGKTWFVFVWKWIKSFSCSFGPSTSYEYIYLRVFDLAWIVDFIYIVTFFGTFVCRVIFPTTNFASGTWFWIYNPHRMLKKNV